MLTEIKKKIKDEIYWYMKSRFYTGSHISFKSCATKTMRRGRERNLPGIFISTLPKSGSVYIKRKLSEGLDIPLTTVGVGPFPDGSLVPERVRELAEGGLITQHHILPSNYNVRHLVDSGISKIVLHVRDPRQALLSWVHHVLERKSFSHSELRYATNIHPPEDFFSWGFEKQVSWYLQNDLPLWIKFMQDWLIRLEDTNLDLKILLMSYEDLRGNPTGYFSKVLDFYEIDKSLLKLTDDRLAVQKGQLHYRVGSVDEWRQVYTSDQKELAAQMIPEKFYSIFGLAR